MLKKRADKTTCQANKKVNVQCPSLMFLVRQREHGKVPWLSCNRTNTAHAHLNTSVLAESSAQAHELQEESKQDTACHKGDKLFFPPVTTAASFHSQTVQACHGEPGGSKICHSLISHYHFHPREPFFPPSLFSNLSKEQAGAHSYKPLINKLKRHFSGNA